MTAFADSPWAPLYVVAGYLAGGLVAFPLIVLIAATAAAFGPVLGFTYALVGSLANALLTYGIGAWLGRAASAQPVRAPAQPRSRGDLAQRHPRQSPPYGWFRSPRSPLSTWWQEHAASALIDYLAGTALGLLPGLLVMSALGYQIFRFVVAPSALDFLLLAGGAVVWIASRSRRTTAGTQGREPTLTIERSGHDVEHSRWPGPRWPA